MNRAEFMKKFGLGMLGATVGLKVADEKIKKVKVGQIKEISDDVHYFDSGAGFGSRYPTYASMAVTVVDGEVIDGEYIKYSEYK